MTADDSSAIAFMRRLADGEPLDISDTTIFREMGLPRDDLVSRMRSVLSSGALEAGPWFDRLFPSLCVFSHEYSEQAVTGEIEAILNSPRMDWFMLACELVRKLADTAGSQVEHATRVVEERDLYEPLLVQTALEMIAKADGSGPTEYERVRDELVSAKSYVNAEGKAIARQASSVPGEIDRLITALEPGSDRRLQEFAIDVLEAYPGRARDTCPALMRLAARRRPHHYTREMAIQALATLGSAGTAEDERPLVEFLETLTGDPEEGVRALMYEALGRLTRHPDLSIPLLLIGVGDEGNCCDFSVDEKACDALDAYDGVPAAQDAIARDVRTRTDRWRAGGDAAFFEDYFTVVADVAAGSRPVLDALLALVAAVDGFRSTNAPGASAPLWHEELHDAIKTIERKAPAGSS